VYRYLVAAIAFDQYPSSWFSTKQVLDYLPKIDRRKCSTVTNALTRSVKMGIFEKLKTGGRWKFKLTEHGRIVGNWALEHAGDFDIDVREYIQRPPIPTGTKNG